MPRFFFHLREQDYLHEDSEGTDLPDLRAVLEEVLRTKRELTEEPVPIYGLEFVVVDSSGCVVLKVPIQERRRAPDLLAQPRAASEERRSPAIGKPRYRH
jgi:hypothetical protein